MKKILSALLTTVMLCSLIVPFSALSVSAKSKYKRSGDWQYIDTAQGVALTRCYAETETVKTPNSIDGKKVVAIDALWKPLFSSNIVKKLIIGDSIKWVNAYVFYNNNLNTIKLGKNVKTFLTKPYYESFSGGEVDYNDYFLQEKHYASSNQVKEITVTRGIRIIADSAFNEGWYTDVDIEIEKLKRLVSIKLPRGLKTIGNEAFYGCKKLKKLTIPKSVTHIGKNAFKDTDIEFTVYKDSYAHKYLKKNGFKKIVVKE